MRALFAALILCACNAPAMTAPEHCIASVYSVHDHDQNGTKTASGIPLNDGIATMALPDRKRLRSFVTVTSADTGKTLRLHVTDYGPFVKDRCADLSVQAARDLGCRFTLDKQRRPHGLCKVKVGR